LVETQELVTELVKEQVSVVEESGPALVTPLVAETRVDTGPQPIKSIKGNEMFNKQSSQERSEQISIFRENCFPSCPN